MATTPSKYGRQASSIVAARLTRAQKRAVERAALSAHLSTGEFVRSAIVKLAQSAVGDHYEDPVDVVEKLRVALGMPAGAYPEEIAARVKDLIQELLDLDGAPAGSNIDPLVGSGEPAAPGPFGKAAAKSKGKVAQPLSKAEAAACRRHGVPETAEGFELAKKKLVRRA